MGSKRLKRIKESWAGLFREEILSELPVEELIGHYDPTQGRPSKEVYAVLGAVLLQQMMDLTDEETIDNFAFNLQWHYALNVTDESDKGSYLSPKTLWKDLFELIERFRQHEKIREMNSYGLLVRVFGEQFQAETSDGESRILINKKVPCDSLQNPSGKPGPQANTG